MKHSVEDKDKFAEKISDTDKKSIKEALNEAQSWLD